MSLVRPLLAAEAPEAVKLLAESCQHDDIAVVAEEKLHGPAANSVWQVALTTQRDDGLAGVAVVSGHWLRLLAVSPKKRRQGVGTALLESVEALCREHGETRLRTMDQPGNYLSPGISVRNEETIRWLEKRGFREVHRNHNLLIDVQKNPRVSAQALAEATSALPPGYQARRAARSDVPALTQAVREEFSAGWAFEIESAITRLGGAVHVATAPDGTWAAFAAHDGNNNGLGWFGPAGTWPAHRKKGIGKALLLACLLDVAKAGLHHCTISWIGPRPFYSQVAGIEQEHEFVVLEKDLS